MAAQEQLRFLQFGSVGRRFQVEHEGLPLLGDLARQGCFTHLAGPQQGNGRKAIQLLQHSLLQPPGHQARTRHLDLHIRSGAPVLQG
jgi:hypothetical protein